MGGVWGLRGEGGGLCCKNFNEYRVSASNRLG